MRIAVTHQKPRYEYDMFREKPDLPFLRNMLEPTMEDCYAMLEEAGRAGADLAVTIETVNSVVAYGDTRFPYPQVYDGLDGPQIQRFSQIAKTNGMHIVAGLFVTLEGKTYNCAVLFDGKGEIVGIHKKVHLPAGEEWCVTPGDRFEVFETELGNIGMLVCWDMQFPEAARELALGGADLIACPTWGWENIYGLSRAYENSVTIAAAMGIHAAGLPDYCDPSCIVDNMGKIVAVSPYRDQNYLVIGDVDINKGPAPQYGSNYYYPSDSMRRTRFSQRKPSAYRLIHQPLQNTPLYQRYFGTKDKDDK